jgi:Zn-dependent M28 family amino/carboxypeptidase
MVLAVLAGLVLVTVVAWWDMIRMPGESFRGVLPPSDEELVSLANELRSDVTQLAVEIGERNVLRCPRELATAADWMETRFEAAGYTAKRQAYVVSGVDCCNVEVEIIGSRCAEEIVIVGAHYDTAVGTPGANDNTTGVAAMLALANKFSKRPIDRTLRFVAFVNEEPPYFQTQQMGSRLYARRCRERGEKVVSMLSLETIGYYDDTPGSQQYPPLFNLLYPSTGNFIAFVGNRESGALVRQVVRTFRQHESFPSEGCALPEFVPGIGYSDQWSFWREGYPALMVTDTAMFRYPYYHHPKDTPDKIDFERMARVVRGLEKVVSILVTAD